MSLVVELALKMFALTALAAVAARLMQHRASAAARHLVWTLAAVGVLTLPIASMATPSWTVPIHRPAAIAAIDRPSDAGHRVETSSGAVAAAEIVSMTSEDRSSSWLALLAVAYAAGVLLLLIRLGVEQWRIVRLVSRGTDVTAADWTSLLRECSARIGVRRSVRLVRSREHDMPMACGLRRPVVVIPSVAETWDDDRRRAVLLHELAHVARLDCLTQLLAEVAIAIYWAHPCAWWIARCLRIERELACDDCVLASGTEPREYAGHLLELAYSFGGYRASALAVSMARPHQLEGRMLAMLDSTRNRTTPAPGRRLLALALAAAVVGSFAAVTAAVAPGPAATPGAQASTAAVQPQRPGTWDIRPSETVGRLELTFHDEPRSSHGTTVRIESLDGLSPALLSGAGGPVTFSLRRDAGSFSFEGIVRSGVGAGTYSFTASTPFQEGLARRGFARPTPAEQYTLALADVGFAFLDELTAQKYVRPTLAQLVNAAHHGIGVDYVRQMGLLGYRLGAIDALVRQRDHGVSPAFIRELQAQGLDRLTADELVRARDHGVSPEYVGELRTLGYTPLTLDALVGARDHGISPEYIRSLQQRGYQLSLADLTRARDHGVSVEYIADLAGLGYEHVSLDDLVRLRDHGVSPQWLRTVKSSSSAQLSIDDLIGLRDHGLDRPEQRRPQLYSWNLRAKLEAWFARWLN